MKKLVSLVLCMVLFAGFVYAKEPDYQEKGDLQLADTEYGVGVDITLLETENTELVLENRIDFANEDTTGGYHHAHYLVVKVNLAKILGK